MAEVTRLLSNIIKGQRVRYESTYKIKNVPQSFIPEDEDKILSVANQQVNLDPDAVIKAAKLDAQNQAQTIIKEAKEKAKNIISEAQIKSKQEAADILEKASQEGYTQGYEKGQEESLKLINEGKEILKQAKEDRAAMEKQLEPQMVEIIIGIVEKLISDEIKFNPSLIQVLIRKALADIDYVMSDVTIKVSPDQYDLVIKNKDRIIKDYANPSDVQIIQDANIANETCIIETPFGSIECNLTLQLNEIKKQMRLLAEKG